MNERSVALMWDVELRLLSKWEDTCDVPRGHWSANDSKGEYTVVGAAGYDSMWKKTLPGAPSGVCMWAALIRMIDDRLSKKEVGDSFCESGANYIQT